MLLNVRRHQNQGSHQQEKTYGGPCGQPVSIPLNSQILFSVTSTPSLESSQANRVVEWLGYFLAISYAKIMHNLGMDGHGVPPQRFFVPLNLFQERACAHTHIYVYIYIDVDIHMHYYVRCVCLRCYCIYIYIVPPIA